jgi:hypothetical protein
VPPITKNKTQCLIKVVGFDNLGKKVEVGKSAVFTINVLNVTFPAAPTDVLDAGHIETVTWNTATRATVTDTKLSYTVDGGLTWLPITTIAGNPGTYHWTVPQFGTDKSAKLKAVLMNGAAKVAAYTSGTFTIHVSLKSTADLAQEFYVTSSSIIWSPQPLSVEHNVWDLVANTAGSATLTQMYGTRSEAPFTLNFAVSPDGQLAAQGGKLYGILSADARKFILTDTFDKDGDLTTALGIKTSSGMTNASLSGDCYLGSMSSAGVAEFMNVTFSGTGDKLTPGTATVSCLHTSQGGCWPDISFTYFVEDNGKVEMASQDGTIQLHGVVSNDGRVATFINTEGAVSSLFVGIRKGTNLSASTISGKFIAGTAGAGGSKGYWMDVFKAKSNGKGAISTVELYTTWPPLRSNTVSYTVGSDGLLTIDAGPSTLPGAISDDGQTFFAMDTDTSDTETAITIGLKTSK